MNRKQRLIPIIEIPTAWQTHRTPGESLRSGRSLASSTSTDSAIGMIDALLGEMSMEWNCPAPDSEAPPPVSPRRNSKTASQLRQLVKMDQLLYQITSDLLE